VSSIDTKELQGQIIVTWQISINAVNTFAMIEADQEFKLGIPSGLMFKKSRLKNCKILGQFYAS